MSTAKRMTPLLIQIICVVISLTNIADGAIFHPCALKANGDFGTPYCFGIAVHPLSYTDAWVKVGPTTSVRLNLFLDDVLRYDGSLPDNAEASVSTDSIRTALQRQTERLSEQLRLFDAAGQQIPGIIVREPKFLTDQSTIRMDNYANVRFSWQMEYVGVSQQVFSCIHNFSHPDLPTPGELRLRIQTPNRRRINTVVAPRRFARVDFDTDIDIVENKKTNSSQQNHTIESPLLTSRIVVSPSTVLLELSTELSVWQSIVSKDDISIDTGSLLSHIANWSKKQAVFSVEHQTQVATDVTAELINDESLVAANADAAAGTPKSELGVRLKFSRPPSLREFHASISGLPNQHQAVLFELVTPFEQTCRLAKRSDDVFTVRFQTRSRPIQSTTKHVNLVVQDTTANRIRLAVICGLSLFVAICLTWLLRNAGTWTRLIASGFASSIAFFMLQEVVSTSYVCSANTVEDHLQAVLSDTYHCVLQIDESATINVLQQTMTDDCIEHVYPELMAGLLSNDGFVTSIDHIQARLINILSSTEDSIEVKASWDVTTTLAHWQHSHRRHLMFVGHLILNRKDHDWKLASVSLTSQKVEAPVPAIHK